MHTPDGYTVTKHPDGKLTVHQVPIFAECFRAPRQPPDGSDPQFDGCFDAAWIRDAVRLAKQRHGEGYFGPLHIRHHEKTAVGDEARPAGTFRIVGVSTIRYEGKSRLAVLADLTITDPAAQLEVMDERLPFRSVEILHPGEKPEFDSLALLDHEVPFLRLPNLRIGRVNDQTNGAPGGTFAEPWSIESLAGSGPMVACSSQGTRTALLFREDPMAETKTKDTKFGAGVTFQDGDKDDDEKKKKGDGEELQEDGGLDVAAIVKAITSGAISIKDFDTLEAAMAEARAQGTGEAEPEPVAPAAVPGGEAMKADTTLVEQFAALKAENVQLRADVTGMQGATTRDNQVAAALKRLEGRALGDIEGDLVAFHKDHGAPAFAKFVEHLAKHNGVAPEGAEPDKMLTDAHPEAMKFSDHGADAVEQASGFVKQWQWLSQNTRMTTPLESYVKINMEKVLTSA